MFIISYISNARWDKEIIYIYFVSIFIAGHQSTGLNWNLQPNAIYGSDRTIPDTLTRDIKTRVTSKLNVGRSKKAHQSHIEYIKPSKSKNHLLKISSNDATKSKNDNSSLRFSLRQTLKGIDASISNQTKAIKETNLIKQAKVHTNLTITEARSKQENYSNESKDVKLETQVENGSNTNDTNQEFRNKLEPGSQNYEEEQNQTVYSGSGKILSAKHNIQYNNIMNLELPAVNNREDGSWSINNLPAEPSSISEESDNNEVAFNNFVDTQSFETGSASQQYNYLKTSGNFNRNNARSSLILRSTPLNGDAGFVDTQHMSANSDRKAKHSKKNLKDNLNIEGGNIGSLKDGPSNVNGLDNGSQINKDRVEMENAKEAIKGSSKKERFNMESSSGIDDFGNLENISLTGDEGAVDEQDIPGEFLEGREDGKNQNQVEVDSEKEIDDQGSADIIGSGENWENQIYLLSETPLKDKTKPVDNLQFGYLSKLQLRNIRLRYPQRNTSSIVSQNGNLEKPGNEDSFSIKQRQGLKPLLLENERTENSEINKTIASSRNKFKFSKNELRSTTAISRRKSYVFEPVKKMANSNEKYKARSNSDKSFEKMVTNKKKEQEIQLKTNLHTQEDNKGLLGSNVSSNNNLETYSTPHKSSKQLLGNRMSQKKLFVKKEAVKQKDQVVLADQSRNKFKTRIKESIGTQSSSSEEKLSVKKQMKKQEGYKELQGKNALSSMKNQRKSLKISLQSSPVPKPSDANKLISEKSGKNTFKRRENGSFLNIRNIDKNVLTKSKMSLTSTTGKQQYAALRSDTMKANKTVQLKQKPVENQNTNISTSRNEETTWENKQASDTSDQTNDRLRNQQILLKLKKSAKGGLNYQIMRYKDSKLNKRKSKQPKEQTGK